MSIYGVKGFEWKSSKCSAVNSLPNSQFYGFSKLKAFADKKINVTENWKFILRKKENIVGKGENGGYQNFLLLPQCF